MKKQEAFTLIELLVVVSVISILSVVLIRLLNIDWHRNTAEDSVRKATIEKIVQGIESFGVSEGRYPDPGVAADMTALANVYVDIPADYTYNLVTPDTYTVYATSATYGTSPQYYIVYFSESGRIRTCSDFSDPGDETSCDVGD